MKLYIIEDKNDDPCNLIMITDAARKLPSKPALYLITDSEYPKSVIDALGISSMVVKGNDLPPNAS